jgi:hypothetical protein
MVETMKPKFRTNQDWELAQALMQPALIRVVDNLRQRLETLADWQGDYAEVTEPYPGFALILTQGQRTEQIALWEFCFQVCFVQYPPSHPEAPVDIDSRLIAPDGELDWEILDDKVKQVLNQYFQQL